MSIFTNLLQRIARITGKQLVITAVYALLLAGSIGLGLASRSTTMAATERDCSANSIDYVNMNGGCGAANPAELVADARANNPGDLQAIYNAMGLPTSDYDAFAREAKPGTFFRDGRIEVDGQVVATNGHSMGRHNFGGSQTTTINGKNYYFGTPSQRWASGTSSLPVMVWFDANGVVKVIIMNPCGNPVPGFVKVVPKASCDLLNVTQPDKAKKPNTYTFTTNASFDRTTLSRVVYTIKEDGKAVQTVEKTSLTDGVTVTLSANAEVSATVYAKTLSGHEIKASGDCLKKIKYSAPMYACLNVIATAVDDQQRKFRFTVKTMQDQNTTVKDATFVLDTTASTTGVTTKDGDGNIYKEYEFTDEKEHIVKVTVYFETLEGVKSHTSVDCAAKATAKKLPKCEVPGFEHLPPNDERCGYCKPGIPKGDARCTECKPGVPAGSPECAPLVETGAGSLTTLFAGTSILGAAGHMVYRKVRASRRAE